MRRLALIFVALVGCAPAERLCGPTNCDGCCAGQVCAPGVRADACGRGGAECSPCGSGQSCVTGACAAAAGGGSGGGSSAGGGQGGGVAGGSAGGGSAGGTAGGGSAGGSAGGGTGFTPACVTDANCPAGATCRNGGTMTAYCEAPCSFVGNAGCTGAANACSFLATIGTTIVGACGASGMGGEGEACTQNGASMTCRADLACINFGAGGSRCARKCSTAAPCRAGQTCQDTTINGMVTGLKICAPTLDACTPNPCFEANKRTCTATAGAAICSCDTGFGSADGGACVCQPQCSGRQCGPDQCGGSCGGCMAGLTCDGAGQCVCVPQCTGKQCGPDGCNGTCGTCTATQACSAAGQCVCVPQCSGKVCGPDGCGGSCGTCGSGTLCNAAGQCQPCTPQCSGRVCGSDSCTGTCGTCSSPQVCNASGQCITMMCNPVTQQFCSASQRCIWNGSSNVCTSIGTRGRGASCSTFADDCAAGLACIGMGSFEACREYCASDGDCANGECVYTLAGTSTRMCSNACNPVSDTGCVTGGCHVSNIGGATEVADCTAEGFGSQGSSCSSNADCQGGYVCSGSQCRKVCSLGTTCVGGSQCAQVSSWFTWGVCP